MTDVEINKALALAIGWKRILPNAEADALKKCWVWTGRKWRLFNYRDWNVIGPIAERYDCFPRRIVCDGWCTKHRSDVEPSPQKAIALAVIKGAKT